MNVLRITLVAAALSSLWSAALAQPNEAPNDPTVGNPPRRDDLVHDELDAPVTPERQAG